MAGDFLKLNRHGTQFYFRRRVPDDLRAIVGQSYLIQSLRTGVRSVAVPTARLLAAKSDILFDQLRTMSESNHKSVEVLALEWRLKHVVNEGREQFEASFSEEKAKHKRELADQRAKAREVALRAHILGVRQGAGVGTNKGRFACGKTIRQVFEEFKAIQLERGARKDLKGGWSNAGRVAVEQAQHIEAFIDYIEGDCPIEDVSEDDVIGFNEFVMSQSSMAAGSQKIRLNRVAQLFKYAAEKKRYIKDRFANAFKFDGQIKKNPYLKFTLEDLEALFESETYRNHQHETSSRYWLPLLGLHTGARINELCQLLRSDIKEIEGVPVISILDEEENKRLKTDASRRLVPIHSKLIELGFLDFVKTIHSGRIFPHLRDDPLKPGNFGIKASEDFRDYRRSVGVGNQAGRGRSRKAFHSFRTTFIDAARRALVGDGIRRRLVGHEFDDTHDTNYNGGDPLDMYSIKTLRDEGVEKVQFSIKFTPYRL